MVALRDIDLTVNEGEFLALVGTAGSGKSTLVQHFNGLLQPTRGSVRVLGRDITDKKFRQQLWHQVGLVFQFPERQIFSPTVFEDIAFGPRNMGWDSSAITRVVIETLAMVGLPEDIQALDPRTLSGGMLRRVAICGVLAMRPRILIMDEPGAGLEPAARQFILSSIKEIQAQQGITVILITHQLEDVAVYADRVALLHQGELLCVDKVRKVLNQTQVLQQAGLRAPFAVELAQRLISADIKLLTLPLTIEDAVQLLHGLILASDAIPGGGQL